MPVRLRSLTVAFSLLLILPIAQAFAKNARNTSSHFFIFPSVRIDPAKRS